MNTPSHRAALFAAYCQERLTDKAAALAVDFAPGSHGLSFWHPGLPEVRPAQSVGWSGIWIVTGEAKRTGGFVWRGALLFALSILSVPVLAAEPVCKVNVAACSPAECAYLPGAGPVLGARIAEAHPKDQAALDAVKGIGTVKLADMTPFVTYAGETTCMTKQTAPKSDKVSETAGKDGAK